MFPLLALDTLVLQNHAIGIEIFNFVHLAEHLNNIALEVTQQETRVEFTVFRFWYLPVLSFCWFSVGSGVSSVFCDSDSNDRFVIVIRSRVSADCLYLTKQCKKFLLRMYDILISSECLMVGFRKSHQNTYFTSFSFYAKNYIYE